MFIIYANFPYTFDINIGSGRHALANISKRSLQTYYIILLL